MCAARTCETKGTQSCAACRVVSYCGRDCQKTHWKQHKDECKTWTKLEKEGYSLADPEDAMKVHYREFRRIVYRHGLDKGDRADLLADFLTDAHTQPSVAPAALAGRFSIPEDDASTFLAWINVGVRFKETNMDPQADTKPDLVK